MSPIANIQEAGMEITGTEIDVNVFTTFDTCFAALRSLI